MTTNDEHSIRSVATTVHGRYLVRAPKGSAPRGWLVGFHGYAQTAEVLLEKLRAIPSCEAWLLASVQALHPFYYGRTNHVVASWMTRLDRERAIEDNIAYVDAVLADLERDFGAPPALVFAGYSQGVAMAYRAAVRGRRPSAAILAVAGDVPPELKSAPGGRWPPVVVCVGTRDEFYTPAKLSEDLEFFRARGIEARPVVFEGRHEWSSEATEAAGKLLADPPATPGA